MALAPAGSGKTSALAVLARAWQGRVGEVIGMAPTAVAADELGRAHRSPQRDAGEVPVQRRPRGTDGRTQDPGGDRRGHRFADSAQGATTLAVRDGNRAALDHYVDNGRVHSDDLETPSGSAYAAWKTDQDAGKTSLLLAATRDTVLELNQWARQDRLNTLQSLPGREVNLTDDTRASRGDLIVTRRNDRSLKAPDGAWVKNGERWRVLTVHPNGSVAAQRHQGRSGHSSAPVTLPAAYVAQHVQLGYASTIQGPRVPPSTPPTPC